MEMKPLSLKTYQFFHAPDGSHMLLELQSKDGPVIAFTLEAKFAREMGQHLIEQANLLEVGQKPNEKPQ